MKKNIKYLLLNLIFCQLSWYNHPELEWQTIETEHFKVHFHQNTERSAREAAYIAEYIYAHVTALYDFEPDSKTEIIIKDIHDYSNGSAYYYNNQIEIWAKPLDYDLRGSHRWLQDVITHEFTHIIQLGKSMKYSRFLPGGYIQKIGYEEEKRYDVLYGYPNQISSYTIPGAAVPPWFAEGTAQYMYDKAYFDFWDSIRDMLLRDRVLNNNLLSFNEMNTFGKCGTGNELVYNQGFSLVNYIVDTYGEEALKHISISLSKPFNYSIDRALKDAIGINGQTLYHDWSLQLNNQYSIKLEEVKNIEENTYNDKYFDILAGNGTTNLNPCWSPNSKKIAFISNQDNDFFSSTDLFIIDDDSTSKVVSGVKSKPTWVNDSLIVYTKISKPDYYGSKYFDLYSYDLINEEEERLTHSLRLFSPLFDERSNTILAVNTLDGTNNIVQSDSNFIEFKQITNFNNGIQIFSISKWESNGVNKYIIDAVINDKRNLYLLNTVNGEIEPFLLTEYNKRDPFYINGNLYYVADKNGIYNLYTYNNGNEICITNVIGGVFSPDISSDNKIVVSYFSKGKYNIAILENNDVAINSINIPEVDRFNSELIDQESNVVAIPYESEMSGPFFLPRLISDYNTTKFGLYFFDFESLNDLSIIGGISYNSKQDLDFSLMFDYNRNYMTYYFNFYWATRHVSRLHYYKRQTGLTLDNLVYDTDYTYHLFSSDIGTRFIFKDHKFWLYYTFSSYRQFYDIIQTQNLPQEYIDDFMSEYETNYIIFDDAYDYYRGHSITLNYQLDGRKKQYLKTMIPHSGFKIDISISYEENNIFDEFKVNQDYGGFIPNLASHDTWRYNIDASKYWKIDFLSNNTFYIALENNLKFSSLSNNNVDDFLYFFGGGLPGLMGYTYYDPVLQGTKMLLLTNKFRIPIISQQAYGISPFFINSLSLGIVHQLGKVSNGKILVNKVGNNIPDDLLQTYNDINWGQEIDALDNNNIIPDNLEEYIYPDIYGEYNDINSNFTTDLNVEDLKQRYSDFKQSIGIEIRLLGFSFYAYPTALTYEYYVPINDSFNKRGRQYLRLLFDF